MIRWQGISTRASFVRANRLTVCPRVRHKFLIAISQARLSLLMRYSALWLPIRFKAFRLLGLLLLSVPRSKYCVRGEYYVMVLFPRMP